MFSNNIVWSLSINSLRVARTYFYDPSIHFAIHRITELDKKAFVYSAPSAGNKRPL